ncbi:hypothetical protein KPSA1_01822 [Pseudomonas syringae pv. actinidiae]|uniref:Uncharacterized protein n=1 Tax=Pseudomonas syringae pv. actinidiae TaxID=103796 RepID=A0A2V0QSP3_PSESF|nr:hypothetical protein KPSA1_01822 [Pseudomonas syringae pv. actinidiae]GBH15911.1 hypothetical protein KPSA3_01844 [Pseudomonas syringae pv. actinidiae]
MRPTVTIGRNNGKHLKKIGIYSRHCRFSDFL